MKNLKNHLLVAFCLISLPGISYSQGTQDEKEAIKELITNAYVDGIFNEGNTAKIKHGWYSECDICTFSITKDTCTKSKAFRFIPMFEKNPRGLSPGTTCKFPLIHVTGYAAIAIVEIYSGEKQVYTDYMNLYKFADGWKIVTKTYYAFPN